MDTKTSPIANDGRRTGNQSHYQQSPLVSAQTRVLNKGDRVQATVSMPIRQDSSDNYQRSSMMGAGAQPVINIAGAPGINLEPSLAASLLRGTNINAYECSTYDRLGSSQAPGQNSKTFLVSTRLSKSMAYTGHGGSNENGSNTSILRGDESSVSNSTACMRSSRDELSSSGSRSMNSSIGSSRQRGSNPNTSSGHEDRERDESSESETRADKSVIMANRNSNNNNQPERLVSDNNNHRASRRKKKQATSSGGQSGDIISQSNSLERPDERNWITSKLIE